MLTIEEIRDYVRYQHIRGVEVVEISDETTSVSMRINLTAPVSAAPITAVPVANTNKLITNQTLGHIKLVHPDVLAQAITVGSEIAVDQIVAFVAFEDAFMPVKSTYAGVVKKVLVEEGQRVDYGMPLFEIDSAGVKA